MKKSIRVKLGVETVNSNLTRLRADEELSRYKRSRTKSGRSSLAEPKTSRIEAEHALMQQNH